jgi:hypothetical protein
MDTFEPDYWLGRANALRLEAARMKSFVARTELLRIARAYECLALHSARQRALWNAVPEPTTISLEPYGER